MTDFAFDVQDLTTLTEAQLTALGELQVSEQQEVFGGSFAESLEAWQKAPSSQILGLCFRFRGQPVGMTLFKRPPLSPAWAPACAASIHGLKISETWQGQGWGHNAFRLAVHRLKEEWPETTTLVLAVDAGNAAALAVYRAFGMADSGPIYDGTNGREHRLEVSLKS